MACRHQQLELIGMSKTKDNLTSRIRDNIPESVSPSPRFLPHIIRIRSL